MEVRPNLHIFITLFALVNPLEGIPFFLAKTGDDTDDARTHIALRAAIAVTIILLLSSVIGAHVLTLFGVSLSAFQAGGGIILFLIAVQMTLVGNTTDKGGAVSHENAAREDIAIVPLAIPLMCGPGAISGAVLYGTRTDSMLGLIVLCGINLLVGIATFLSLRAANRLRRLLGSNGINISTRLMGLLIAGMATSMTVEGITKMVRG